MSQRLRNKYNAIYQHFRFALSASNSVLFRGFYKYFYRPVRGSMDDFLDRYSKSKFPITVIQIGANDGLLHDPVHKFIKRDLWQGVIVEPQSYLYENFLARIYRKNKGIHTLCAAIGMEEGLKKLYKIGFSNMRWATGLASFDKERIMEAFDRGRVKAQCDRYGIALPASPAARITSEDVPVIHPATLLNRYKISEIDLLVIDTEGYDYQILEMFDIARTQPGVVIFEHMHLTRKDMQASQVLLENNGYAWRMYGKDTLAMKQPVGPFSSFFHTNTD